MAECQKQDENEKEVVYFDFRTIFISFPAANSTFSLYGPAANKLDFHDKIIEGRGRNTMVEHTPC